MLIIHEFRRCDLDAFPQFAIGVQQLKFIRKILVINVSLIALLLLPLSVLSANTIICPAIYLIKPMLTRYAVFLRGVTHLRIIVNGLDFFDNLESRSAF